MTQGHGGGGGMSGAKRPRPDQAAAQPSNNPYAHSSRRPDGKLPSTYGIFTPGRGLRCCQTHLCLPACQ